MPFWKLTVEVVLCKQHKIQERLSYFDKYSYW